MDKIKFALDLLVSHRMKLAFAGSLLALLELGYIYVHAMQDGQIDAQERAQIQDASERVVDSLP